MSIKENKEKLNVEKKSDMKVQDNIHVVARVPMLNFERFRIL